MVSAWRIYGVATGFFTKDDIGRFSMSFTLQTPKALLWDWDGTLADSWPLIYFCLKSTFEHMGVKPWTEEEAMQRSHAAMQQTFPALFGERWQEAGEFYRSLYRSKHLDNLCLMPDVQETVGVAYDSDLFQAVVSNKLGDSLRKEVQFSGLGRFFSKVVGSGDVAADKPSPDLALLAAGDAYSGLGKQVWFIGDTVTDMRCAHACGFTAILIGAGETVTEQVRKETPPALHVQDHAELKRYLLSAL